MSAFSKKETIFSAWHIFWANWKFLLGLQIFSVLISFIPAWIIDHLPKNLWFWSLIFSLGIGVIQLIISVGFYRIYLQITDSQLTGFKDLFSQTKPVLKYLVCSSLITLIILAGFLLLIIPGIIFSVRLQFWPWLMVDKNLGIKESLSQSWQITRGNGLNLFLLGILLFLINLAGLFCLGVGLLIAIPLSQLVLANVYRKLST